MYVGFVATTRAVRVLIKWHALVTFLRGVCGLGALSTEVELVYLLQTREQGSKTCLRCVLPSVLNDKRAAFVGLRVGLALVLNLETGLEHAYMRSRSHRRPGPVWCLRFQGALLGM